MYPVFILCGGLGTRIKSKLNNLPKALATFDNNHFIINLIKKFAKYKVEKITLCLGHKGDLIESEIKKWIKKNNFKTPINFSYENIPLGTGGAIKNALKNNIASKKIVICNGDTWIDGDLNYLLKTFSMNQLVIKKKLIILKDMEP